MPEDAAAYLARNYVRPTLSELLDSTCRDMPESADLTAYLLDKLKEKFPDAAKTVELTAEQTAWKASKVQIFDRLQMTTFIEDLRWNSFTGALLERVLYERPKNVPAFLIELLAKGDVAAAGPTVAVEDAAATKLQAGVRGRKTRKNRKQAKAQEPVVVPKAADASEQVEMMEAEMKEQKDEAAALAVMEKDRAATKMQAIQRGKNTRKSKK